MSGRRPNWPNILAVGVVGGVAAALGLNLLPPDATEAAQWIAAGLLGAIVGVFSALCGVRAVR
jgi:hypothetical protein